MKNLYLYPLHKHKDVELTIELTLTIRLGEPLIRDGKSNTESKAGAR